MSQNARVNARSLAVVGRLYFIVAVAFFFYLFQYYLTTTGGPTLLAFTMVPVCFILFTLDALRRDELYPRLPLVANFIIAAVYIALSVLVAVYMYVEFEAIGTERAGIWDTEDLLLGGLMVLLIMEYSRKRHFSLFVVNILLILYAMFGFLVPGVFGHPGLNFTRIVTMTSLEDTTGIFSNLPQLALTLIGSFVLVLSVLRAFGCIDSILKGAGRIATKSAYALPQTAVVGSFAVAAVSGSGAANAVTTGSATIPALIESGMPRENAAAIESASSLGGQLMPPIMGISAFLMADFMGRSYFDVVARGYAPALIYFFGVALGVYLMTVELGAIKSTKEPEKMGGMDWVNLVAFLMVVLGLMGLMAAFNLPPMFAALYIFGIIGSLMLARSFWSAAKAGGKSWREMVLRPLATFFDNFSSMVADLTLLLATLSILTSAFVNTGVPPKVGTLMVSYASVSLLAMVLVAFVFGALLGMGLPPAPTYILTALVIAPHMMRAGVDPWPVHFFSFFLAVWGELTPPTSVVAAVTSKIAQASFMKTLWRSIELCSVLFVLMAAVFVHPELVQEPGWAQIGAMLLIMVVTLGTTFSLQGDFSKNPAISYAMRGGLMLLAMVTLFHGNGWVVALSGAGVLGMVGYWVLQKYREGALTA